MLLAQDTKERQT